jgi:hypothetical protein
MIIVIPAGAASMEMPAKHCRWLSRGESFRDPDDVEPLLNVLQELDVPVPAQGLAAIRLWGQTGVRPEDWVSAADPVYLEAMLDHVRLHSLDESALSRDDRAQIFGELQAQLGDASRRFELIGDYGYVRGKGSFATAGCSAKLLDAHEPEVLPPSLSGSREHDRLVGELQLLLHQSPMNRRREEQGLCPANSIWFWGGGHAPQTNEATLPPLYSDDPLYLGCWRSMRAPANHWPGETGRHVPELPLSCVAVLPAGPTVSGLVDKVFNMSKRRLARGQIRRLTLVFSDGLRVRLRRRQLFAFWRSGHWPGFVGSGT